MPETTDPIAQQILKSGLCTEAQVQDGLEIQQKMRDMGINPKPLPEILLDKGHISKDQFRELTRGEAATAPKSSLDKDSISGYEILSKIGQGGMGAVFRARQLSMDRVVALKVLPPRLAKDAQFRERFLREARAVAKLNHENIIQGIDVGVSSGLFYFVMEFVDGKPVSKIMSSEKQLDEKKALRICAQIARALEHANRHKMVHRDVKPENMMLTEEGVAKLCDLGLAKQEQADTGLTQAGLSVGTPNYISPEQARGEGDVDVRSDLYSLGASLYHMVAGVVPFEGNVPSVVMTKHITEDLVPPIKHRPDLSAETNAIIVKAMQKRREDRYQDPAHMATDLEAAAAGKPLVYAKVSRKSAPPPVAGPPPLPGEPKKSFSHHPVAARKPTSMVVPVVSALVVAVAILGGVVVMTRDKDKPKDSGTSSANGKTDTTSGLFQPEDQPDQPPVDVSAEMQKKIEDEFAALTGFIEMNQADPARHRDIEERLEEFIASHRKTAWENKAIAERKKYRDGMDGTAQALLAKIRESVHGLRVEGKSHEAATLAKSQWLKHLDLTPTAERFAGLVAEIDGEMQEAWKRDRERATELMRGRDFEKAAAALDGVKVYGSPEILGLAATLRDDIRKAKDAYAASLVDIGRRRFDLEFKPALEKCLFERKWKDALSVCGKFHTDPEMVAVKDRISALIEDISSLNTILSEAAKGADVAAQSKETVVLKKFEVRITRRDGDRVSYAFTSGGSSEINLPKAAEDDIAALCWVGFNALPAARKTEERGPLHFRIGLLFFFTADEKNKKRAGEEFEKALREGVARAQAYLDQLGDKAAGDQEAAARKLYDEAFDALAAKKPADAKAKFRRLLDDFASTAWVKDRKDAILQRIAEIDGKSTGNESAGIQKILKGTVVRTYGKGQVEVKYDFTSADQIQDWEAKDGTWTWDKDTTSVKGTAGDGATQGLVWSVPLGGDVAIEAEIAPIQDKNMGLRVCNDQAGRYYLALLNGVFTPAILATLGNPDLKSVALTKVDLGGVDPFQVLGSTNDPRPAIGAPIRLRISKSNKTLSVYAGGKKVLEATDTAYSTGHVSLFLMAGEARFDEITIFGTPDEKWLKSKLGGK